MESIKDILETKDGTRLMIQECVEFVKESTNIIIFGAGVGGRALYNLLVREGLENKVVAFSDNNQLKFYHTYMSDNLQIIPPEKLIDEIGMGTNVVIASSAYDVIKKQLVTYGYPKESIVLFNFAFMDLEYTDKQFIWDNIENFQRAYDRMADEKSREIFADILNYKITKKNEYLYNMQKNVDDERLQYFPSDLFEYSGEECFLDIGAYVGDTLETFDEVYHGKWEAYYAFEADRIVFAKLWETVQKKKDKNKIRMYNLAAWNEKTNLYFEENAGSSSMGEEIKDTKSEVKAEKLDDILEGAKVTFVKMDIEGAEKNAIRGMRGLLQRNKPIVAMCVYHLRDDFFALTDLIEETCPGEYLYYFRQYRFTPTETVCYAIPRERLL